MACVKATHVAPAKALHPTRQRRAVGGRGQECHTVRAQAVGVQADALLNGHRLQRLEASVAIDVVARNGLPIVPAQQQHMQVVG